MMRPARPSLTTTIFGALVLCSAALSSSCADDTAHASQLPRGGGGGDKALQKTRAEPALEGALALEVETLARGVKYPWSIALLPDGNILFTEKRGALRLIRGGALVETPITGAPDVFDAGQGGLLDILLHPDYSDNGVVFLSYAHGDRKNNALRIARGRFDGDSLTNLEVIYEAAPLKDTAMHYGGRLAWGGDGKIYAAIGEGSKYKEKAQDFSSSFGAVIRINEDGTIPADNPDIGAESSLALFSKGHRNPQGLVYDAGRGVLWEHEHGPRGGDEINIITPGANYGWPAATYGIDYNGGLIAPFTEFEGTEQPVKYWTPSIAPSGLAVYRGDLFDGWEGDLLVGALAGNALHRIIMEGDQPVGEERYLIGARIRDVRVGSDGAIYVATEIGPGEERGRILRLTPATAR